MTDAPRAASRTIVIVRHGHYDTDPNGPQRLTDIGIEQAELTAAWLRDRGVDIMLSSRLPRARQTAEILSRGLGDVDVSYSHLLREGMYSKIAGYTVPPEERREDRVRAERAFTRFFRPTRRDRVELYVSHGNLIRYLVCRSLGVPAVRWTRMVSHNCGITTIVVRATGAVRVVSYNQTAHLPPRLVT
ncbi:MAG: histidine phosphatase family protein [Myxococcales bacterium]|nr:histidine phosphatase family protein [Myxococcales bacterium]